jgi:hypothetical protein
MPSSDKNQGKSVGNTPATAPKDKQMASDRTQQEGNMSRQDPNWKQGSQTTSGDLGTSAKDSTTSGGDYGGGGNPNGTTTSQGVADRGRSSS